MRSFFLFIIFLLSLSAFGAESYRHGQIITFKWEDQTPSQEFQLELKFNSKVGKSKIIATKGNSYELRLKKMPRRIFWRVYHSSSEYIPFKEVSLEQKLILKTAMVFEKNDYYLKSTSLKKSLTASGPSLFLSAEYFPEFLKGNKSLRLSYIDSTTSSSENKLKKRELDLEFGYLLRKTLGHHQVYLGYYLYDLDYQFTGNSDAAYSIQFVTARHLYRKRISDYFEFEMNTSFRIPYPLILLPSLNVRPGIIYRLNQRLGLEGFFAYDRFEARVREKTIKQTIDLKSSSFGAGIGLVFSI